MSSSLNRLCKYISMYQEIHILLRFPTNEATLLKFCNMSLSQASLHIKILNMQLKYCIFENRVVNRVKHLIKEIPKTTTLYRDDIKIGYSFTFFCLVYNHMQQYLYLHIKYVFFNHKYNFNSLSLSSKLKQQAHQSETIEIIEMTTL